ncbi:MAG: hypothetical protein JWM86_2073 [Thermoleophilia bacterium]|nr:hypothetical protein [Thermoleophilia bacterium]
MDEELSTRVAAWDRALLDATAAYIPDGPRTDVHVHLGVDAGTGEEMTLAAITAQADQAQVEHAVLIPLHESDGYGTANSRLASVAAASDGRFSFLARVDPAQVDEAGLDDAFEAGAVGIKLHPDSDEARPGDPRLRPVLEAVAERGGIVLVHAGIDVDGVSEEVLDVAKVLPDARFVIGHLAADRLGGIARGSAPLDNVSICTAWWGVSDLVWALSWNDPSRFVFGSDPPFGSMALGLSLTTRAARCAGYDDDDMRAVIHGNAARLLAGDPLPIERRDEGPRTGARTGMLGRLPAHWQRAYVSLEVAAALVEAGKDPATQLQLAKAALEPELIESGLEHDVELIDRAIRLANDLFAASETRAAYIVTVGAQCLAGTSPLLRPN